MILEIVTLGFGPSRQSEGDVARGGRLPQRGAGSASRVQAPKAPASSSRVFAPRASSARLPLSPRLPGAPRLTVPRGSALPAPASTPLGPAPLTPFQLTPAQMPQDLTPMVYRGETEGGGGGGGSDPAPAAEPAKPNTMLWAIGAGVGALALFLILK